MILNIIAIVLSGVALAASTYLTLRQRELQRAANGIPAYMQLTKEFRTMEFNDNYRYVTTQLQTEHDPHLGVSGLPDAARRAVYDVAYFFQGFATLRLMRVLDDEVLTTIQIRTISVWEAVKPYVEREREIQSSPNLMRILESFARDANAWPSEAMDELLARRRFAKSWPGLRIIGRRVPP